MKTTKLFAIGVTIGSVLLFQTPSHAQTCEPSTNSVALKCGMKGYWKLDQTNGVRFDSSPNGYHLAPVNNVGFTANGKLNGAAMFNAFAGDQGLTTTNVASNIPLGFIDNWALSTWVKHAGATRWGADNIIHKEEALNFFVEKIGETNRLRLILYTGTVNPALSHTFNYGIPSNTWQHLILQRDQNSIVLYVNGQPQETVAFTNTISSGNDFWIGMDDGGWPWNGSIDEVGYWGRSLNGSEVAVLYGNGNPPAYETFTFGGSAPVITEQPQPRTVNAGSNTQFSVSATGTQPLKYQWQFGASNIIGATNSTLLLTNVAVNQAGNYRVSVTNSFGSAISSNALLTVVAATNNPGSSSLLSGLKAYWKLDQTNGVRLDSSANSYHLAPVNNVGFDAAGKLNGAAAFNAFAGDPGLATTNIAWRSPLAFTNNWTLSTWVKHAGAMRWVAANIVHKEQALNFYVEKSGDANYLRLILYRDGLIQSLSHTFNYAVPSNTWQHLVLQKDQNSIVLYVNGQLHETVTFTNSIAAGEDFWIGTDDDGWPWNGSIDEVGYWGRSLSSSEVAALFGQGTPPSFDSFAEGAEVAPYVISHPSHQSALPGATVSFGVTAGGTGPLGYQWFFNGGDITGATNRILTLTNVQTSAAGGYSVRVTNSFGAVTSAVATLNITVPPSALQIGSVTGMAGAPIAVPIRLLANGRENALGFSISFNSQLLTFSDVSFGDGMIGASWLVNTNAASSGRLGLAAALPPGATLNAGTQDMAVVYFQTRLSTNSSTVTPISFADQPTLRQVSDAQAASISATYSNGVVTLRPADLEGDVTPRPTGNRSVTITDWVQVGRFAAGLDAPAAGGEFQRADCAPKAVSGDGKIKVSDWVQAGRFAAGLDPLTAVGGPSQEVAGASSPLLSTTSVSSSRELFAKTVSAIHQVRSDIAIGFKATGHENAFGFTVQFDPTAFRYNGVTIGSVLSGATVNVNTNQLSSGKIGFAIALPLGSTLAPATHDLLTIALTPSGTTVGPAELSFADEPVYRSISDPDANELPTAFVAGVVTVHPIPQVASAADGQSIRVSWPVWASGFKLQSGKANAAGFEWQDVSQSVVTDGETLSVTIPMEVDPRFYRLVKP